MTVMPSIGPRVFSCVFRLYTYSASFTFLPERSFLFWACKGIKTPKARRDHSGCFLASFSMQTIAFCRTWIKARLFESSLILFRSLEVIASSPFHLENVSILNCL